MQLPHSSTPDPALSCTNPSRSDPVWAIPREIISLFSGFGEGKVQGKEEMSEKQENKKDTRLDKKTERARELRVPQTLEEHHRKKVTRLEKGLGKQNTVSFSSLLALVFQSGRKYLKPGRQHSLASRVQPGNEASLTLFSPLRAASSQNTAPRNLHGVWRERLPLTHIPPVFAGILLTLSHMQSCRATPYPRGRHLSVVRDAGQTWNNLPLGSGCSRSSWWRVSAGDPIGPSLCRGSQATVPQTKPGKQRTAG